MNRNELRMRLDSVRDSGPNQLQAHLLTLMYNNLDAGDFSDEHFSQLIKLENSLQPEMEILSFKEMLHRIFSHYTFLRCTRKHRLNAESYSGWKRYQIIWHELRPVFKDKTSALYQKLAEKLK